MEEDEERRRRGWKIEGWIILSQRAEVSELSGKKKIKKEGPVEPSWEGERFGNPPSLLLSSHHSVSSPSAEPLRR